MEFILEWLDIGIVAFLGLILILTLIILFSKIIFKLGRFAVSTTLQVLLGILIGTLIDVRSILLVTINLTLLAYYEGESWRYLASISALVTFCLSAFYVIFFLALDVNETFKENSRSKIKKEIFDAMQASAGLWGVLGITFSFPIICFLISNIWKIPAFKGGHADILSLLESINYTLQLVLDIVPGSLSKNFGWTLSEITVDRGQYTVWTLTLIYQLLLLLSLGRVVVRFWKISQMEKKNSKRTK